MCWRRFRLGSLVRSEYGANSEDLQKKKFYRLTPSERRSQLVEKGVLTQENALIFEEQTLSEELSDHMIENQVSEVETPMGIAQNFQINGKKKWIPMATEEPSVIAAASNGAKICGNICAETPQRLMRGQIVLSGNRSIKQ